jgi:hypothetical protein
MDKKLSTIHYLLKEAPQYFACFLHGLKVKKILKSN